MPKDQMINATRQQRRQNDNSEKNEPQTIAKKELNGRNIEWTYNQCKKNCIGVHAFDWN